MDDTDVLIVGAGPSGLVLGLLLAQYEVKSIILEKEWTVQEDPRGIVMMGDGVRTLNNLGMGQALAEVSQQHQDLFFHLDSFKNAPYLRFPQHWDFLEHALPTGCFMVQPRLEKALRKAIEQSGFCELRVGCEVTGRQEEADGVVAEYVEAAREDDIEKKERPTQMIRARWMVGADGKKGVVRKRFLEPAGITQQVGVYPYTGVWIAANLKITLPTPETHPDLPVWKLGISPESLYDIFWPDDWHFVTHPTEAVATGRFGPAADRLWRHEFELSYPWEEGMDALEMFWNNLIPSITRDASSIPGLADPMTFPRDCIKVLRCRPFTFVQKVAGPTWHHKRTIIVGDAAHVFPPFGGQGIVSGVRDAVGLSWRLAILLKQQSSRQPVDGDTLLANWYQERRAGVDHAVEITMTNGKLTNQKWRVLTYLQVAVGTMLLQLPWLLNFLAKNIFRDDLGYKAVKGGFFLSEYGGGGKVSQIFVQERSDGKPIRSDNILCRSNPLMTIFVISSGNETSTAVSAARKLVQAVDLNPLIVSDASVCVFDPANSSKELDVPTYLPCTLRELSGHDITPFLGYDENTFMRRIGSGTKFAIVRTDTIIFSLCKSVEELEISLNKMKDLV